MIDANFLEILTHEFINSVGLVSMNFELLADGGSSDEIPELYKSVEHSLSETVETLQLVNACAISLQAEVLPLSSQLEYLVPLLKWHVKRYGLPQTFSRAQWTTSTRLDFVTDEAGIFERGESGLPMTMLKLMLSRAKLRLNRDASTITIDLEKSPKAEMVPADPGRDAPSCSEHQSLHERSAT